MIKFKKILASAATILLIYSPLSNAALEGFENIPAAGQPNFTNTAEVSLISLGGTGYLLAATNSDAPITFNDGFIPFTTPDEKLKDHPAYFLLTAQFTKNGDYISNTGSLSISGDIRYPSEDPKLADVFISGDILSAKLVKFAFDANTIAFSTKMLSGFGTLYGDAESVYLSKTGLGNILGFGSESLIATTSPILGVDAITTVPIPGAGWLLGSVLGVFTLVRRNRLNLESAS